MNKVGIIRFQLYNILEKTKTMKTVKKSVVAKGVSWGRREGWLGGAQKTCRAVTILWVNCKVSYEPWALRSVNVGWLVVTNVPSGGGCWVMAEAVHVCAQGAEISVPSAQFCDPNNCCRKSNLCFKKHLFIICHLGLWPIKMNTVCNGRNKKATPPWKMPQLSFSEPLHTGKGFLVGQTP